MVDARMPEKYLVDRRVMRLSDSAFRAFVVLTMWSVSNRTDGQIAADDLPLIPRVDASQVAEVVAAGLATATGDGWALVDYIATQTSRSELEILENNRRREREKKARQRGNVPREVPGDVSPGTAQARQARQARQAPSDSHSETTEPPSPFCANHPAGAGGAPCGPCRDARVLREMWEQAQVKATPTAPSRAKSRQAECVIHEGYVLTPECAACERESHAA